MLRQAIYGSITILSLMPSWSLNAIAYEYSLRHAFCSDYARQRSSLGSSSFQYDLQVAYNSCMRNAENLIQEHESRKARAAERNRELQIRYQQQRQAEREQQRLQEQQKANFGSNMEYYFR